MSRQKFQAPCVNFSSTMKYKQQNMKIWYMFFLLCTPAYNHPKKIMRKYVKSYVDDSHQSFLNSLENFPIYNSFIQYGINSFALF